MGTTNLSSNVLKTIHCTHPGAAVCFAGLGEGALELSVVQVEICLPQKTNSLKAGPVSFSNVSSW